MAVKHLFLMVKNKSHPSKVHCSKVSQNMSHALRLQSATLVYFRLISNNPFQSGSKWNFVSVVFVRKRHDNQNFTNHLINKTPTGRVSSLSVIKSRHLCHRILR